MEDLEPMAIAVIDHETNTLHIYNVPEDWQVEDVEKYLLTKKHNLRVGVWGTFDGTIHDNR
jgi:hypothetical protein